MLSSYVITNSKQQMFSMGIECPRKVFSSKMKVDTSLLTLSKSSRANCHYLTFPPEISRSPTKPVTFPLQTLRISILHRYGLGLAEYIYTPYICTHQSLSPLGLGLAESFCQVFTLPLSVLLLPNSCFIFFLFGIIVCSLHAS